MASIRSRARILAALSALVLFAGCATEQAYLTLASTRAVSLDDRAVAQLDLDQLPRMRNVEGSDTAVTSVLFFPTMAGPDLDAAVDDAIERGHGDLLTSARVSTTKYWLLLGIETLTVRGTVIDLPEAR